MLRRERSLSFAESDRRWLLPCAEVALVPPSARARAHADMGAPAPARAHARTLHLPSEAWNLESAPPFAFV